MISIICPVFNKELYLDYTIKSVIEQSVHNWELILVDDGSSDRSIEISEFYSNEYTNIQFFERSKLNSNSKGANACRNLGASLAKFEHLIFLDADDYLSKDCIKEKIIEIEKNPTVDIYFFKVAYVKGDPVKIMDEKKYSLEFLKVLNKDLHKIQDYCLNKFLKFDLLWHTSSGIWKKKLFHEIGGFNENYQRLQDPEIHTKLLLYSPVKLKFFPHLNPTLFHRIDDDRKVWDAQMFFNRQFNSIIIYVNDFYEKINDKNLRSKVYLLQGYLLFAEMLIYEVRRKDIDSYQQTKSLLNQFYSKIPHGIIDWKYKIFRFIMDILSKNSFFLKRRFPGALVYFYKKLL